MRVIGIISALAILIAGCAGEPVVADIGQDKVQIVANGAPNDAIQSRADQACAMYNRSAQVMSHRCGDAYCLQKMVLFACVPPSMSTTPTAKRDASGRQYSDGEQVSCSFPNSPNPHLAKVELTARACSQSGGTILGPVT